MIQSEDHLDDHQTFLQVILEKCKLFGNRRAYIDAETKETITFEDILHKTKRLSKIFAEIGIRKGDIVAICTENNIYYPIIFMACLYSGIALNCINNNSTSYELENLLGISKPKLIISSESTFEMVTLIREKLDFIESQINLTKREDCNSLMDLFEINVLVEAQPVDVNPMEQVALIMNTSGTTGLPKAAQLTHNNLKYIIGYVASTKFIDLNVDDITISVCPFYHMYGFISMVSTGFIDCAVIGKPDEKSGEVAMAFVVKKSNCNVIEQDIIDYVAEHVSNYKQLHGGVTFIDEIPKSAAGKILRKELGKLIC